MKEFLNQIERDVPYNSFGTILDLHGVPYSNKLGGNCIRQGQLLAAKLRKEGYFPQFVSAASDVPHYAVLCREEGRTYYLDPFLLHHEPICISRIMKDKEPKTYDAYPIVNGTPSKVVVTPQEGRSLFTVSFYGVVYNENHWHIRDYSYDLRRAIFEIPASIVNQIASSRQRYFNLRILREKDVIKVNLNSRTGKISLNQVGKRNLCALEEYPQEFFDELRAISSQLQIDVTRVLEPFYEAHRFYRQMYTDEVKS